MESLVIRRNRIVHLSIQVIDTETHEIIERSDDAHAHFVYLHGHKNLVPALESALAGLQQNDTFDVTVTHPYGAYLPEARCRFTLDAIDLPEKVKVGDRVTTPGPNGLIELTLIELSDETVTLDGNHPLAGRTLRYTGQVLQVLRAHKDEIRHHRPHPAGHHLMVQDSSFDDKMDG